MAQNKIEEVEGIGPVFGEKLRAAGVTTTDQLLAAGKTKDNRAALAQKTGIGEAQILKWVNMVDLFRIKGVASEFAELLEAAGVDTVKELKHRVPANLAQKIAEVNQTRKLTRRVPTESVIAGWIEQAKKLPPAVEY